MIDTKIWSDSWVRKLNALDRYLFIYLLTNDKCSYCGIYELPISMMAFESGIDERDLEKSMLPRLEPKIFYHENWVNIVNFRKFHVSGDSDKSQKGYENALSQVPSHILQYFKEKNKPLQAPSSPSVSIPSPSPSSIPIPSITETSSVKGVFSFKEEIQKLEDSPRRELNIIAHFFEIKKPDILNYEQFQVAVKRHLRPAKMLIPFTNDQIINAIPKALKSTPEYTLDTLLKVLTK